MKVKYKSHHEATGTEHHHVENQAPKNIWKAMMFLRNICAT